MKKILVVLLVLAVVGGVFAQEGEWGVSASARVGGEANFKDDPATIGSTYDDGWNNKGTFGITYNNGGLSTGLDFTIQQLGADYEEGSLGAWAEYAGDNYHFKIAAPMALPFLNLNENKSDPFNGFGISSLWGYYDMLGGMVRLIASYKDYDNNFWVSNNTVDRAFASLGGNGLHTNVTINALQFGIAIPDVFEKQANKALVDDVLLKSKVGFKFSMSPVEFAVNFGFEQYKAYVGANWSAVPDVLTFGLSFFGEFDTQSDILAGLDVDYKQDVFGAGIAAKYIVKPDTAFYVGPRFWYKVLPDTFYFQTDLGFTFAKGADVKWEVTPQIAWNFLQTGATDFGGLNTGIGVKFSLVSNETSKLYVGFKWGM